MSFQPVEFEGRPLADVLTHLGQEHSSAALAEWQHRRDRPRLRSRKGGFEPPTVEIDPSLLLSAPAETCLVQTRHRPVSVPDVSLETYLGGGLEGWVYAGRVRATGLMVAVKVLRGDYVQTGGKAAREAMILAKFRHDTIRRVFQFQPAGPFWVVIMEFVNGLDVASSRVPEHDIKRFLGRIADALRELAHAKVVHRDVKPANILLRQQDSSPVLVDFGLAVDLTNPLWKPDATIIGTPMYMAPEALSGGRPEPGWDAYSLGMTAVALLLGKSFLADMDMADLIRSKQSGEFGLAIERALTHIEDASLRNWCLALINEDASRRMIALDTARAWIA